MMQNYTIGFFTAKLKKAGEKKKEFIQDLKNKSADKAGFLFNAFLFSISAGMFAFFVSLGIRIGLGI